MIAQQWHWEAIDQQLADLLATPASRLFLNPGYEASISDQQQANSVLNLSIRLLSHQQRLGDVCIHLPDYAASLVDNEQLPALENWQSLLTSSNAVGLPGDNTPLILDQQRLYFQRYWLYEQQLAEQCRARMLIDADQQAAEQQINRAEIEQSIVQLQLSAEQQQAVANSLNQRLSIITGGPGTGKTTIIGGLISVILQQQPQTRIALAAPTGKAAARMQQALASSETSRSTSLQAALNTLKASTIHRLLGYRPGKIDFAHNQQHPLPYDLVVVDEASMIDLSLMSKLICALKAGTRLILLGDADQLAAVETGAVFGELCQSGENSVLRSAISRLQHSYRFAAQPGIGALASAVNQGNSSKALALLDDQAYPEINWLEPQAAALETLLSEQLPLLAQSKRPNNSEQFVAQQGQFQLLCAHREGRAGVVGLNQHVESLLRSHKRIDQHSQYYCGKPLLITQNNHGLDLYNGDLGVVANALATGSETRTTGSNTDSKAGSKADSNYRKLSVYFSAANGQLREFSLPRLPAHETAWALTVHKSQGSEFDTVVLVLPDELSPVLSRELIYTAITRAKRKFTIIGHRQLLASAIAAQSRSHSGLADKLK